MAFTRVQGNDLSSSGPATALTVAVTISAVGSGNTVCGLVSWDLAGTVALSSVTDDKGNTYNLETTVDDTSFAQRACAFSRTNITNGPVTITANFASAIGFRSIFVDEFSGGSTASSDERDGAAHGGQFQSAPGTGTDAITSGTFTTSTNGDLLYGCGISGSSTTTATNGTGFSSGAFWAGPDYCGQGEYQTQSTAGAGTAATFTQGAAASRTTFLITIKPAAGGGDTLSPQIRIYI